MQLNIIFVHNKNREVITMNFSDTLLKTASLKLILRAASTYISMKDQDQTIPENEIKILGISFEEKLHLPNKVTLNSDKFVVCYQIDYAGLLSDTEFIELNKDHDRENLQPFLILMEELKEELEMILNLNNSTKKSKKLVITGLIIT